MVSLNALGVATVLAAVLAGPVAGQATGRVSVGSGGAEPDADSFTPSISSQGRHVAFLSFATNLVDGDWNWVHDLFVRDLENGTTECVSVDSSGLLGNDWSYSGSLSSDGRYVAFWSSANNLVSGDTNVRDDVFVRDRQGGTTERVSVGPGGIQANGDGSWPSISADGRFVAFQSWADNLVVGDTNQRTDVFVHDLLSGKTERVSVSSNGAQQRFGEGQYQLYFFPSISADGRYVAFESEAANLVGGDTNGRRDIFVHDRRTGVTERVSIDSSGVQGDADSKFSSISAEGRYVAFGSEAANLVAGDTNQVPDAFVRDRQSGTTERASVDSGGAQGNGYSGYYGVSISADGRYATFTSLASNLVPGDTNGGYDVFVRDRLSGTTERVSVQTLGAQANNDCFGGSISADGRYVAFESRSDNLAGGDTNGFTDVFVRDRAYSPFDLLCEPGVDGVIDCPCGNRPTLPDRGCNNGPVTGGASLWASGVAYLSDDSLVFTTGSEPNFVTSIVVQGNALLASGVAFGQGVRCAGGALERLYTKTAPVGSITAPDFGQGDPAVSVRSAQLGDAIQPAQTRWYFVYYRASQLFGCPPGTGAFNATPTAAVAWLP